MAYRPPGYPDEILTPDGVRVLPAGVGVPRPVAPGLAPLPTALLALAAVPVLAVAVTGVAALAAVATGAQVARRLLGPWAAPARGGPGPLSGWTVTVTQVEVRLSYDR